MAMFCRKLNIVLMSCIRQKMPVLSAAAPICTKEMRDPDYVKPLPWPYEKKKFSYFHWFFQSTTQRFDENTKIIVVEGNIGSGKTAFAKSLAESFDMKFIPEPTMDRWYLTEYGYDLRELDPIVPPSYKSCDLKTFYKNPKHPNLAMFQFRMFMLRYIDYIDALAHLLNTGDGIVMERCVFSDLVFMETMHKMGYIKRELRNYYKEVNDFCTIELLRPHLIVYLDITPETALKRIKERNDPSEVNSPVLTKEYLASIEHFYKQAYLKQLQKHTEVLIYDWNNFGDTEVVIEDIERMDFDKYGKYDDKLRDWRRADDWEWGHLRMLYTNNRMKLLRYATKIRRLDLTELCHPRSETVQYLDILKKVPGLQHRPGFNPSMGDNVLFKLYDESYRDKPIFVPQP